VNPRVDPPERPQAGEPVRSSVTPIRLKGCFADPLLDVMNVLNEIVLEYPDAISFAPGRPLETTFDVRSHVSGIGEYVAHAAEQGHMSCEQAWRALGQYNRTNGIINQAIASHLERDEGIRVPADAIMVTVGAQEAMAVVLAGLFDPCVDVLLVSDPTYIGITGLARILDIRIAPVPSGDDGLDPGIVERAIRNASRLGNVRALYDIPDFSNPLGTSLPVDRRIQLIEVCRRHGVLLIEDNPYGMFAYDGERLPTLKALDSDGTVLYIGSFSKTLFPALRVGFLVADRRVAPGGGCLARELSRVKSLLTVNTSTLCQAVVARALMTAGGSIEAFARDRRRELRRNRDALVAALEREFAGLEGLVSWNRPAGGFFATLTLPFEFGAAEMRQCAADYKVIACPMNFFSIVKDRPHQVRLSFSYVDTEQIAAGVARLARFVHDAVATGAVASRHRVQ
jgi:(S)-3,5-dihydroxyphenylglycine transaminase